MSWLYGQTWLWYLIAFLVGVLLAWLLLVRPQQRRLCALDATGAASPPRRADGNTDDVVTETFRPVRTAAAPAAAAVTERFPHVDDAVTEQFPPAVDAPVLLSKGDPSPVEEAPAPAFVAGPYPGSALPAEDGSAPSAEFTIKGNADSGLYHTPSSPYYSRTKAEAWFTTAEDAEAAGFTAWKRK